MLSTIWHTAFFDPIYNGLIYLIDIVPGGDVGIAIVVLTIIVKVILLPVSLSAARTQRVMREIEPKLTEIKERTKDDREALARETLAAYREAGVNPFSSIFLLFIQIPIVIALYLSVYSGGGVRLPDINTALLYSFVPSPTEVSMLFFGGIDIAAKSFPLAALAGITQYFQAHLSFPAPAPRVDGAKPSFKDDFARSMHLQVKYVMPVIIFFFAYTISASIALYFVVSNLLGIAQEYIVRQRHPRIS
jgi:YidC/Oxa1 family membrane protein insertase